MTQDELQHIVDAVLSSVRTNSRTISELTRVSSLGPNDTIEIGGGKYVTYSVLEGLVKTLIDTTADGLETLISRNALKSVTITVSASTATLSISSNGKTISTSVPVVSTSQAGLMSAVDKAILLRADEIAQNAKIIADVATRNIIQLQNEVKNQKVYLLQRIQGISEDSEPYNDPFKLVEIDPKTMDAFNTWLDNLHPVDGQTDAEKRLCVGFFRVIVSGLQYEVHNLITAWGANRCQQVLYGIVTVSGSGKIQGHNRYNMLQRDYDGQKWSEWEPVGGTLRTASINGKPLPVSGSNVNLNTGKGLQVESGDTLTLKLGTGMRYGADGELVPDVTASDKEELQNGYSSVAKSIIKLEQKDAALLKRIQGTSEDSKPYEDPFKLVTIPSLDAFNSWLDDLHPANGQTTDEKKLSVGFFRVIMSGLQYEVHNFILSWSENRCHQVLYGIVAVSSSGTIQGSNSYNILQREYDGSKWSEWTTVGGAIRSISVNDKRLPVSGGNINLQLGTGLKLGTDGKIYVDISAIMNI